MGSSLKKLPTVDIVVKAEKDKKESRIRKEKRKKIGTKEDGGRAEEIGEGAKGKRVRRRSLRFYSCLTSMETNERNNLLDDDNRQQNLPDYRAYLKDLQEASQAGFDSLRDKAKQLQCKIPSFTKPEKVNFVQGIDKESQERIPTGSLEGRYFALSTHGDGNCLFRAASILAFGDENKHLEMRVRTLVELACNKSYYSKFPKIESGDVQAQEARESEFQEHVHDTCKESSWASDCHLRALPTLFGRSIKIVFAEGIKYDQRYFIDLKDVLRPRGFYSMLEPLVIMMTNVTKEERPNHFVPLVPAGEYRSLGKDQGKIECFGDLSILDASQIANKLGRTVKDLLWTELEKELRHSKKILIEMMLQSKGYPIRKYTNSLEVDERERVIKLFRKVLPTHKGVIGPLLSPDMPITKTEHYDLIKLTKLLSGDDRCKTLAKRLGVNHNAFKAQNPALEVVMTWGSEKNGTVGELYDILVDLDLANLADYL